MERTCMGKPIDISLAAENEALRERLTEMEETLHAIRTGQVDALVDGTDIYTLDSVESASNRFRGRVLQEISETVIAVDNDNHITYINEAAEKQYGRMATDVIGLRVRALYEHVWVNPGDEQAASDALRDTGQWRGEHIQVKLDGRKMNVESVITVLRDEDGNGTGLLAVMRDITRQVQDRDALNESARQKDHFLATLAHELRNPLAPLMNGLQLLDMDGLAPEVLDNTRGMMQRQLDQLVRLVDDLLDMSRISRGNLELRTEQLDLAKVLSMAMETSKPLIDRNGHQLELRVEPGVFPVHGDSTRLAQIISNLLNNAAKYTPSSGVITVGLAAENGNAVLSVSDNGIGIASGELDRIFEMFTQVDASLQGAGGLGIGLNIAKRLATLHQGTLEVRSEGRGKGSCFTFSMPMNTTPLNGTSGSTGLLHGSGSSLRILVVDDNRDVASSMVPLLHRAGHMAEAAHSGEEALRIGSRYQPHLVLMDIGMPAMNGYDACKLMRAEPWGQRARIVAISGWGQEKDRQRSQAAGFDEHMVKPIEGHSIQRLLRQVGQPIH